MISERFAIIVHSYPSRPIRPALFNAGWWGRFVSQRVSDLTGVSSPYGRADGCLVILNLDTFKLQHLSTAKLLKRTIRAGKKAARLGVRIIGFGLPLLKALGSSARVVARSLDSTVTSGTGCAAVAAIDGIWKAADLMGINLEEASVLVMGAAGPFGSACTQILARDGVNHLTLIDCDSARLDRLISRVLYDCGVACKVSSQAGRAVAQADLIIAAGGKSLLELQPFRIKSGAVVCNPGGAEELTRGIMDCRPDVMIFDQSILRLPGRAILNHDPGLPISDIHAPMAEAILLALEGRFDRYFLGPMLRVERLIEMRGLIRKHGFELSGFAALNSRFDFAAVRGIKNNRPA